MRLVTLRAGWVVAALATVLLFTARMHADSVELINGDVLHGRILGVDDKELRLESAIHGRLSIPRAKVVSITFGDRKVAPAAAAAVAGKGSPADKAMSVEDLVKQLPAGGVNPKDMKDLQKLMPLLATPEASRYFNSTLQGLQQGKLSVQDIRRDAIRARDQAKAATKGLGPDVEMALNPYLSLLEQFIRETDPAKTPAARKPGGPAEKK